MTAAGHVLIACDKFKGSLTQSQVAEALSAGLRSAAPDLDVRTALVADGGEGTLAAAEAAGFTRHDLTVAGPTGQPNPTAFALHAGTAVVELADACGLQRLPGGVKAPLEASSRGLGEAVRAALDAGAERVVLGVGGSASTDGGTGMLRALGARFLDSAGNEVPEGGGGLRRLAQVDLSGLDPRIPDTRFVVACDVSTPLLGEQGCVELFSAQKGADEGDQQVLEYGLGRLATILAMATGRDDSGRPGAGAAGGVGFGAVAVLGAQVRAGLDVVLEFSGALDDLSSAALVVTGEGSLDDQSLHGKVPVAVAARCRESGVPVVAVCGRSTLSDRQAEGAGFAAVYPLSTLEPDRERCMAAAGSLLTQVGAEVAERHL